MRCACSVHGIFAQDRRLRRADLTALTAPTLLWLRRDLRLADHPALTAALADGGAVIPVFVLDPETEALGAAAKWRLGLSLADLASRLADVGSRLILRRGDAPAVLADLAQATGATTVRWTRLYAPDTVARDQKVKTRLRDSGIAAESHPGFLLHEPWEISTKTGSDFKVFTPFWNSLRQLDVPHPLPEPRRLHAPDDWPRSETLKSWRLGGAMQRGADIVAAHVCVGEAAARARLDGFLDSAIATYHQDRDRPDRSGSSGLSENLTWGEISPRAVWHAGLQAREEGRAGADAFLRQLAWREFAWHLLWHAPDLATANWRDDWNAFPWRADNDDAERWRRGMTGEPMVDAGMRELFVTGTMHNRLRLLTASYLTKHLLTDWRVGLAWFEDCLIDWDPASNALGWQWTAGSGPDAAPFFRIFSPERQAERFDPDGAYRHRFVKNFGSGPDCPDAVAYFDAVPRAWGLDPETPNPAPVIEHAEGRRRALAAYEAFSR